MVGIVLVSHSRALALSVQEMVRSMTGAALAQGVSSESPILPQPTAGSHSAGGVTSSTPPPPLPAPASAAPADLSITNLGTSGQPALPGPSSNTGTGTR